MTPKPPHQPAGGASPGEASDEDLFTSEDLFGDLVDAPPDATESAPKAAGHHGPIKVQVAEPGQGRLPEKSREILPEDVSFLLDAFGGDALPPEPALPDPALPPRVRAVAPPRATPNEADPDVDAMMDGLHQLRTPPTKAPLQGATEQAGAMLDALLSRAPAAEETAATGPADVDLGALADAAISEDAPAPPAAPAVPMGPLGSYGPYQLLERVARGGMAEVFKAKRTGVEGFEKIVAVKRILPLLSENREFVDMFVDEAKLVAGLTHPNIVQIFDLGRIETTHYIAMEYLQGRDVRSIQKRAIERNLRIPMDLCGLVVSRVCLALEYAHRKKDSQGRPLRIVHRDISPQNILISFEGDVKLTDFGIAKAAAKASTTDGGALRGKLLYMSPEQAWGRPLDRRSDVFSLGVVFYELLAGQKPFHAESGRSVLERVRECRLVPLRAVVPRAPEELEAIVMRALAQDPDERYQSAAEMHRDLERVLHERQAPTSAELARFLELIFDQDERGEPPLGADSGEHWPMGRLELDFDTNPTNPSNPTDPVELREDDAERTAPGVPRERGEIQKLLDRFRMK